ncbi:MAG: hypothetical protein WDW38_007232 [Sanguina aurantia]
MAAVVSSQVLPSKEGSLFRQVVKHYEAKQYKKALRAADTILKRFPEHGETLSMKGLTYSYMDRKEEAYELVRRGVKYDLKSHVCWHVYGLLYRADRDYKEAIKCYMNALRIDKENILILRDLALLQIQTRDLPGFVETRQQLLNLKPSNRAHWVTFAVAHHINGSCEVAAKVLDQYESSVEEMVDGEAYEQSEMVLYKASVLAEGGKAQQALEVLERNLEKIRDVSAGLELKASLLLKLNRRGQAVSIYKELVERNPDHYQAHAGLHEAASLTGLPPSTPSLPSTTSNGHSHPTPPSSSSSSSSHSPSVGMAGLSSSGSSCRGEWLSEHQRSTLSTMYDKLTLAHPFSSTCRRIPLDFKVDADFRKAADKYLRRALTKGIPSLFVDLRPLYSSPAKASIIAELVMGYEDSLREYGSQMHMQPTGRPWYPPLGKESPAGDSPAGEPQHPSTRVWVLLYLAQHHVQTELRFPSLTCDVDQAIAIQDGFVAAAYQPRAGANAPHQLKNPLRSLLFTAAAHAAELARRMDLSDRYLNSTAVKALFRAGYMDAAEMTAALFTKDANQVSALHDMQHMQYEVAAGKAHYAQRQYGKSLKMYLYVVKHFGDMEEDQLDFHNYCVRKSTLRAYVAMLRMEDTLYSHSSYTKAVMGAVRVYLDLHDKPVGFGTGLDEGALAGLSPEELKKAKLKRKKEEKKRREEQERQAAERERVVAEKEAAEREAARSKGEPKKKPPPPEKKEVDLDPYGAKLIATQDPLGEATKLVEMLKRHAADKLTTHTTAFEVYTRKGRLLLALSAVQRGASISGLAHPAVHKMLVRMVLHVHSSTVEQNATVRSVITEALQALLSSSDASLAALKSYHDSWVVAHGSGSLAHRLATAEAGVALDAASGKAAAAAAILSTPLESETCGHVQCVQALRVLERMGAAPAALEWKQRCAQTFQHSETLDGAKGITEDPYPDLVDGALTEAFGKLAF